MLLCQYFFILITKKLMGIIHILLIIALFLKLGIDLIETCPYYIRVQPQCCWCNRIEIQLHQKAIDSIVIIVTVIIDR